MHLTTLPIKYELRQYDDPILKIICNRGLPIRAKLDEVFDAMERIMLEGNGVDTGVGIAAPQISCNLRIIIVGRPSSGGYQFARMVYPEIIKASSQMASASEGCLSYPGIKADVQRHRWIKVQWQDSEQRKYTQKLRDLTARVFQHEFDHLNGVCHVGDKWRQKTSRRSSSDGSTLCKEYEM